MTSQRLNLKSGKSRKTKRKTKRNSRTRKTKRNFRKRNSRGGGLKELYKWVRDTKTRRELEGVRERRELRHRTGKDSLPGYGLRRRTRVQPLPVSRGDELRISRRQLERRQIADLKLHDEQIREEDDQWFTRSYLPVSGLLPGSL